MLTSQETIVMYTDGASRGNPGPASLGVYIETLHKEYSETLGITTNNDAEYQALVFGLKKIKALLGKKEAKKVNVECRLDSELVVKQMNHEYKIEHEITQKHFLVIWNLMLDFQGVRFVHVSRERNTKADALANEVLDGKGEQLTL
jgi:ribonuclease HI